MTFTDVVKITNLDHDFKNRVKTKNAMGII
jgi:hypothetical protein